jgi:hypothetical protein
MVEEQVLIVWQGDGFARWPSREHVLCNVSGFFILPACCPPLVVSGIMIS